MMRDADPDAEVDPDLAAAIAACRFAVLLGLVFALAALWLGLGGGGWEGDAAALVEPIAGPSRSVP